MIEFSNFLLQLRNKMLRAKLWLFYYFYFERNYDVLKPINLCFLLKRNIDFSKNEKESNVDLVLEKWTLCFSSYKNCKWKVKLWWFRAYKRKKSAFFVMFYLSQCNIFSICVLSQCIMSWVNFQNIYTFTYQKHYLNTFLFVFKIIQTYSVSLRMF